MNIKSKQNFNKKNKKVNKKTSITYLMHGKHPVLAAINNNNRVIKTVFCLEQFYNQNKKKLINSNVQIVDTQFLRDKVGKEINHQGVIANVEKLPKIPTEELLSQNVKDKIIILDQITDPQNIGAIIRSAAAFGASKVVLPENGAPEENATIAKAACGCLELVKFTKVTNINKLITALKKNGYWIVGLDGDGEDRLTEIAQIDKLAIIVGSEGKGLRKLTSEHCDFTVKIPINDNVESLNASCAASIVLYALNL